MCLLQLIFVDDNTTSQGLKFFYISFSFLQKEEVLFFYQLGLKILHIHTFWEYFTL